MLDQLPTVIGAPPSSVWRRHLRCNYFDELLVPSNGVDVNLSASDLARTICTASATPHTKGAWAELIASTSEEMCGLELFIEVATNSNGVNTNTLLDVGIGSAGSEQVIIPDVQAGWKVSSNSAPPPSLGLFPVFVPRGSRLAIRCQSIVASKTVELSLLGYKGRHGYRPASKIVNLTDGVVSASSRGVGLVAVGSTNLPSATANVGTAPVDLCGVVFSVGGNDDTSEGNNRALLTLMSHSTANPARRITQVPIVIGNAESVHAVYPGVWPFVAASGDALHCWWQCDSVNSSMDVIVHGVPA